MSSCTCTQSGNDMTQWKDNSSTTQCLGSPPWELCFPACFRVVRDAEWSASTSSFSSLCRSCSASHLSHSSPTTPTWCAKTDLHLVSQLLRLLGQPTVSQSCCVPVLLCTRSVVSQSCCVPGLLYPCPSVRLIYLAFSVTGVYDAVFVCPQLCSVIFIHPL